MGFNKVRDLNVSGEIEKLNMHSLYLLEIKAFMSTYGIAAMRSDYNTMHQALCRVVELSSAKFSVTDLLDKLDTLEEQIDNIVIRDSQGNPKRKDLDMERKVKKGLRYVFTDILRRLQEAGILTFIPDDPRKAMGDFSGS